MQTHQRAAWWMPASVSFVLGISIGAAGLRPLLAGPAPNIQRENNLNPQERTLDANLYMQTSAEYRAVCLQTYGWMTERLRSKLAAIRNDGLPPAVVMDLDETVVDNAGFQSFLDRERLSYSDTLWENWEKQYPQEVRLIPGAKSFIEAAEGMGVSVIYLSNRLTRNKDATIAALKHNGLSLENIEERLLLKADSSNKTARRQQAEQTYRVLFYVGGNLRDFPEDFVALKAGTDAEREQAIQKRAAVVDKFRYRWGNDWFILPNPVYGEWQRLISSEKPHAQLRATQMQTGVK